MGDVYADFLNSVRDIQPTKIKCVIRMGVQSGYDLAVAGQIQTGVIFSNNTSAQANIASHPVQMLHPQKPTTLWLDFNKLGPRYQGSFGVSAVAILASIRFYSRGNGAMNILIAITGYGKMSPSDEWQIVIPSLTTLIPSISPIATTLEVIPVLEDLPSDTETESPLLNSQPSRLY
jgi:hypothetical protein